MSPLSEVAQSSPRALLGEEGLLWEVEGAVPKGWCCCGDPRHCPALSQPLWGGSVSPQCGMESSGAEVKVWMSQDSVWS